MSDHAPLKVQKAVLIIDDDRDFTHLAKSFLSQAVETVHVANDPVAGLAAARQGGLDLILCDVGMPGMNGFELKRQLSADPALAELPFVFISAHAGADSQLSGLRLGATDYLTKPILRDTLVSSVLHHLNPKRTLPGVPAVSGVRETARAQLSGRLDIIPIADLLQLLEASRATGVLGIQGLAVNGEMVFKDGRIVGAHTNHRAGEDAALRLVWMKTGDFSFRKQATPHPLGPEIAGGSISRLLIDAAWLHDELARLGDRAPGVSDSFLIKDRDIAAKCFPEKDDWHRLIDKNVGGTQPIRIGELAEVLDMSTYRARAALGMAAEQGGVEILAG